MLLSVLLACAPAPEPFTTLQADFFAGLALRDDATRAALPTFEARFDAAGIASLQRHQSGARDEELGLVLMYAGFVPHAQVHAVEDGHLPSTDLRAKMERSRELLRAAQDVRPTDARIPVILRSVEFNLASFDGPVPAPLIDSVVDAAREGNFGVFTALVLLRDPALHPMDTPYMERLLHVVCAPERFGCDGPPPGAGGPPAAPAPGGPADPAAPKAAPTEPPPEASPPPEAADALPENALTRALIGPVMVSDLLVRRAEALLTSQDPATAPQRIGEAMGRLQAARGFLAHAQHNLERPDLAPSPARATLTARSERIDALLAAATGGPVPSAEWYRSPEYRVAYDCAACHTAAPGSSGVPR